MPRYQRRLAAVLRGIHAPAADMSDITTIDIPDPIGNPPETRDKRGNSPLGNEIQGLQRFGSHPPPFDPTDPVQFDKAFAFYVEHG